MFEELFAIPAFVKKYRAAPLAEPRARYLRHLKELGACRTTLRKSANNQLSLVRLLDMREGDRGDARPDGRRRDGPAASAGPA